MRSTVAVNMLWCVPGVGGSQEYLVRQLLGTTEVDHDIAIEVFAPRGFSARVPELAGRLRVVEAPSACRRRVVRVLLEHTWLAWRTRGHQMVHHGGGTMPRFGNKRALLTLHDVQWTTYPGHVSRVKLAYLRRVVPSSLRRAVRIAVPSSFVAHTLTDNFGVAVDKVDVVRHGVEPDAGDTATPEAELRRRWSLGDGPVVVYPAITHPHKNHLFLLSLMTRAGSAWADPRLRLVLAGSAGRADAEVRAHVAAQGLAGRVVLPGRISAADRNGLLAFADAMVFPSTYEGFGAPLIEAMHLGAPVLASDRASIPEVVGDAGIVVELREELWAGALESVRARRGELVAKGHERARLFTTRLSGIDVLAAYRAVMGGGAR